MFYGEQITAFKSYTLDRHYEPKRAETQNLD